MALSNAYAAGVASTRKDKRSFMPAVNALSDIIANRRRSRGGVRRGISFRGPDSDTRADIFFAEKKAEEDERYAKYQLDREQRIDDEKRARNTGLLEAEEARRQEAHEQQMESGEQELEGQRQAMESQRMAGEQQAETFERAKSADDRKQAFDMVKQGLMTRDAASLNSALNALIPEDQLDAQSPQFVFSPDSEHVGVIFPGQEKPTVFKNAEDVFKNVLAPMNPKHEKSGKLSGKEQVQHAKNVNENLFKNKELYAKTAGKAHEAAMSQFEADGWYQPSMYDKAKYDAAYKDYMSRTLGVGAEEVEAPPEPSEDEKKAKAKGPAPENLYEGNKPPPGVPNAEKAPDGRWWVKKGDTWYPVIKKGTSKKAKNKRIKAAGVPDFSQGGAGQRAGVIRKPIPTRP